MADRKMEAVFGSFEEVRATYLPASAESEARSAGDPVALGQLLATQSLSVMKEAVEKRRGSSRSTSGKDGPSVRRSKERT